jgi:hypothetical protein
MVNLNVENTMENKFKILSLNLSNDFELGNELSQGCHSPYLQNDTYLIVPVLEGETKNDNTIFVYKKGRMVFKSNNHIDIINYFK